MKKTFLFIFIVSFVIFILFGCATNNVVVQNSNLNIPSSNQVNVNVNQAGQEKIPDGWQKYVSTAGVSFSYPATSEGRSELAPSGIQKIKVQEKTTNDGSQIIVGSESAVNNGMGDITIEIHKIPQGKTAEAYAKELADTIIGTCSYNIVKKPMTDYVTYEPAEIGQQGCFTGLIVPSYDQYNSRADLLINAYWVPDPFLTQEEIDSVISSITVN